MEEGRVRNRSVLRISSVLIGILNARRLKAVLSSFRFCSLEAAFHKKTEERIRVKWSLQDVGVGFEHWLDRVTHTKQNALREQEWLFKETLKQRNHALRCVSEKDREIGRLEQVVHLLNAKISQLQKELASLQETGMSFACLQELHTTKISLEAERNLRVKQAKRSVEGMIMSQTACFLKVFRHNIVQMKQNREMRELRIRNLQVRSLSCVFEVFCNSLKKYRKKVLKF